MTGSRQALNDWYLASVTVFGCGCELEAGWRGGMKWVGPRLPARAVVAYDCGGVFYASMDVDGI